MGQLTPTNPTQDAAQKQNRATYFLNPAGNGTYFNIAQIGTPGSAVTLIFNNDNLSGENLTFWVTQITITASDLSGFPITGGVFGSAGVLNTTQLTMVNRRDAAPDRRFVAPTGLNSNEEILHSTNLVNDVRLVGNQNTLVCSWNFSDLGGGPFPLLSFGSSGQNHIELTLLPGTAITSFTTQFTIQVVGFFE